MSIYMSIHMSIQIVYMCPYTCRYTRLYTCRCTCPHTRLYKDIVHRHAIHTYYLHHRTHVPSALENANFSKNRQNDAQSFSLRSELFTICGRPSLDNVVLIDFCSARLHYFAKILGCNIPMPSVLAILWDTHRFVGLTMDTVGQKG